MNRAAALVLGLALAVAGPAPAEAPESSLRPVSRPVASAAAEAPEVAAATAAAAAAVSSLPPAIGTVAVQIPDSAEGAGPQAVPALRPRPRPTTLVAARPASAPVPEAAAAPPPDRPKGPLGGLFGGEKPSPAPPPTIAARPAAEPDPAVVASAASAAALAPPPERPKGLFQRTAQPAPRYPKSGSVCGVPAIRGEAVKPIGRSSGCGIAEPVRVTAVSGVQLSVPATIDCTTAKALMTWIEQGAKPAVGKRGGGIAGLQVAASYACRNRNNASGGRLSEHAKGRAIDIASIILNDGSSIKVLGGWRDKRNGPVLKRMHQAACGPFGTVLGPNADRYHQDHLHFDTARYRTGPYCR